MSVVSDGAGTGTAGVRGTEASPPAADGARAALPAVHDLALDAAGAEGGHADRALSRIARLLLRAIGVSSAAVSLRDAEGPPLVVERHAEAGAGAAALRRACEEVLAAGAALPAAGGPRTVAARPLRVAGDVVGALAVGDRCPRVWSGAAETALAEAAAAIEAVIAVRRARATGLVTAAVRDSVLSSLPDTGVMQLDEDLRVVVADGLAFRDHGWRPETFVGRRLEDVLPAASFAALAPRYRRAVAGETVRFDLTSHGRTWAVHASPLASDGAGGGRGAIVVIRDVTEVREAEDARRREAEHDPLTGLPNRVGFRRALDRALARAHDAGTETALVFLDLDEFRVLNDSLGHGSGDEVLLAIARRCRALADGPGRVLARLGGDEFAVVAEATGPGEAEELARRLQAACSQPLDVRGIRHVVTASSGIAVAAAGGEDGEALLRDADAALHEAKRAGRGAQRLFAPEMHERVVERLALEVALRRALDRDELEVHFQPVLDLAEGRIVELEALVRWPRGPDGPVGPDVFVPVAEQSGLIVDLGRWVLRTACRELAAWRRALGDAAPRLAVNLSARELAAPGAAEHVAEVLHELGLPAAALTLELTETTFMATDGSAARTLRTLQAMGVRVGLDDFGTGFSSLGRLKRLRLDVVKVDRSFVSGLRAGTPDHAIVRAVLGLAEALQVPVVAEGVETDEELAVLRELGCRHAQGYLLGRPAPSAATRERLGLPAVPPAG